MKNSDIDAFLQHFGCENLFEKKKVIEKDGNLFLSGGFAKDKVFDDSLLFIRLKNFLPSTYFLEEIFKNSRNKLEVISQRQALDFTYGKSLAMASVKRKEIEEGKYYLILFKKKILGYVSFRKGDRFPLRNEMNIGEYLREY